ncbi:MAG: hypothetical protein H6625_02985 [Bdellovibrionaceae bacterium]|nr:hypothetical protein [Pseudobdellovibrionaceae bacterium]
MANDIISTARKAHIINEDDRIYGTFAEIGAGQEVARYFFQAGHASRTIAKTMSAYDMTFSDEIYGKALRYVSRERLNNMLDHEYKLLSERLSTDSRCFFTYANTVATDSHQEESTSHAWMGLRFQLSANGPVNEILIHVNLLDRMRLQQQEAVGILGVNLIYAAVYLTDSEDLIISSLMDNLYNDRVQIDFIHFSGEDLKHLSLQKAGLQMLAFKMSHSLIFSPNGEIKQSTDHLYGKSVVILRGTFAPITKTNLSILEKAEKAAQDFNQSGQPQCSILEFTIADLEDPDDQPFDDYLSRIETINASGHSVMVTNFPLFFQIKSYLRKCTKESISIVIGASLLEKILDESYYEPNKGGILNAFGKLFDHRSRFLVFPYKTADTCTTAKTFHPNKQLASLYNYLLENQRIVDILGCEDIDTSLLSSQVRDLMKNKDPNWKKYVPEAVCQLIENKKLFGYK